MFKKIPSSQKKRYVLLAGFIIVLTSFIVPVNPKILTFGTWCIFPGPSSTVMKTANWSFSANGTFREQARIVDVYDGYSVTSLGRWEKVNSTVEVYMPEYGNFQLHSVVWGLLLWAHHDWEGVGHPNYIIALKCW